MHHSAGQGRWTPSTCILPWPDSPVPPPRRPAFPCNALPWSWMACIELRQTAGNESEAPTAKRQALGISWLVGASAELLAPTGDPSRPLSLPAAWNASHCRHRRESSLEILQPIPYPSSLGEERAVSGAIAPAGWGALWRCMQEGALQSGASQCFIRHGYRTGRHRTTREKVTAEATQIFRSQWRSMEAVVTARKVHAVRTERAPAAAPLAGPGTSHRVTQSRGRSLRSRRSPRKPSLPSWLPEAAMKGRRRSGSSGCAQYSNRKRTPHSHLAPSSPPLSA